MRKSIVYAAFIAAISSTSCNFTGETIDGNGNLKSEIRNVGNSSSINVLGGMDVFVDQGAPSVKVEGDENILKYIEIRVR
ncbi:MAG: hypothetical protein WKG06_16670 [Segetibacter sp.]